jgi:hypothetical protein
VFLSGSTASQAFVLSLHFLPVRAGCRGFAGNASPGFWHPSRLLRLRDCRICILRSVPAGEGHQLPAQACLTCSSSRTLFDDFKVWAALVQLLYVTFLSEFFADDDLEDDLYYSEMREAGFIDYDED